MGRARPDGHHLSQMIYARQMTLMEQQAHSERRTGRRAIAELRGSGLAQRPIDSRQSMSASSNLYRDAGSHSSPADRGPPSRAHARCVVVAVGDKRFGVAGAVGDVDGLSSTSKAR